MDIGDWERELKKRWSIPYRWGSLQNNRYDQSTKFIYHVQTLDALKQELRALKDYPAFERICFYALNRWYNFWSAKAVEGFFKAHPRVRGAANDKDREKDFYIDGIAFDHKTSIYPRGFSLSLQDAKRNPQKLADWLYRNQSREQRFHLKNRLFVVLYNHTDPQSHWKLKAELAWLQPCIKRYLDNFNPANLLRININGADILTDIIWAEKRYKQ